MTLVEAQPRAQRWWARAAFAALVVAILLPVVVAGVFGTLTLLVSVIGTLVVMAATGFWFLAGRGAARWISLAIAILTPIAVLVLFVSQGLLWVVIVVVVLVAVAFACARVALAEPAPAPAPETPAPPPSRPFLVMNPHSGGGTVVKHDLVRRAEELGAEVALLEGPGYVDVEALARDAVARGADLLGVAGGDGTQALVAGVAAEHDLPFLVISAGTRNHFALDLGLDRDDPAACVDALRDGLELRVDLGMLGDRAFVNNASFGVYAEIVRSPAYRDDKRGTVLKMLPDLLGEGGGPRLSVTAGNVSVDGPQAVLISNGPYRTNDLAGLGRRTTLNSGVLGVVTVSVANARQAVGLIGRVHERGMTQQEVIEAVLDSDTGEVAVGLDGESLSVQTPVTCRVLPGALRVRVPLNRPGVRPPKATLDWVRLRSLAWGRTPTPVA
ncbi:diacylglycerol/lipid kinase family protein [Rhodococcus sp. NPDC003318]|uniref:diacylglycerol/lipid kinase family protein n=1 Tax=Rhodococcus sp. NPDC003318 TaxID=3364503 RepID=UPI0036C8D4B6